MLKTFQNLGYFPQIGDVPPYIIDHLLTFQDYPPETELSTNNASLTCYRRLVRERLDISRYRDGGEAIATAAISQAAQTMSNPADLINAAVEELVHHRFELPAYRRIDDLAATIRTAIILFQPPFT